MNNSVRVVDVFSATVGQTIQHDTEKLANVPAPLTVSQNNNWSNGQIVVFFSESLH